MFAYAGFGLGGKYSEDQKEIGVTQDTKKARIDKVGHPDGQTSL